jgi:hypothetical protein
VVVMMVVMMILERDLLILKLYDYRLIYDYGRRVRRSPRMPLLLWVTARRFSRGCRGVLLLLPVMGLRGCGGGAWREDCFVEDLVDILEKA